MVAIITQNILAILSHPIFLATAISFILSQVLKVIILLIKKKPYALQAFYRMYGGMPSTHTAVVSAVSFSILLSEGVTTLFMLSLFWSITIISDVVGVKWFFYPRNLILKDAVKILNKTHRRKLKSPPMEVGHSLEEVLAGIIIAFASSYLVYFLM